MKKTIIILLGTLISLQASNSLVIYNKNIALVNKNLERNILPDDKMITIKNISENIIEESVVLKTPDYIKLFEQNYEYNTLNYQNILKYYKGKEVSYKNKETYEKGKLLSINNPLLIKNKEGLIIPVLRNEIAFSKIPNDIRPNPSLKWRIENKSLKEQLTKLNLQYLTTGLSWKSNYTFVLNNKELIIDNWISLNNTSNVKFKNYKVTFLAGNIRTQNRQMFKKNRILMAKSFNDEKMGNMLDIHSQELQGYQVYELPFNINIPAKSKKQIKLFNKKLTKDKYKITNEITIQPYYQNQENLKFNSYIEMDNKKENNLGIPFPQGKVRFYKNNKGKGYFLGETNIKNIPKNEKIKLTYGKNFNSVLNIKVEIKKQNKYEKQYYQGYEIKNNSNKTEEYIITQKINQPSKIKNYRTDCNNDCKELKEKTNLYKKYKIIVKPNKIYKFRTFYNYSYKKNITFYKN